MAATTAPSVADRLGSLLRPVLGGELPLRLRAWDGSEIGPEDAPVLVINDRQALRRMVWQPNQLGLARGWVAGELDIEGDLYHALQLLADVVWRENGAPSKVKPVPLLRQAVGLGILGRQPEPPLEEIVMSGRRHSRGRDRNAISHHYDVSNDFYRLVLGPSMVYSCAYWPSAEASLETAQREKLDLICRKLGLVAGQRLLDVGCGWGSLAIHAAREYGVSVVGITIAQEQAELARKRVADAGLTDLVQIHLRDYREVNEAPFDAVASIGMAEHVGTAAYGEYASILARLLRPGGRLLNHQIAARHESAAATGSTANFINRYVFPDGELVPLAVTTDLLETAGFEVRDVQALRPHYAHTLRAWVRNLEAGWDDAVGLVGAGRARVWRLYMAACALAFESDRLGVNQILAVKPYPDGHEEIPMTPGWHHR